MLTTPKWCVYDTYILDVTYTSYIYISEAPTKFRDSFF